MSDVDISRERIERLKSLGVADYLHMAMLGRIEELEAANRGLVRLNEATEARAKTAEAKLKTSEEIGRAFEEDAGQLRAKLAKALAALDKLARLGNGEKPGNSDGNMIARSVLAEINGGGDT